MWDGTKSTIALGLAEIVERLTTEEKQEFTQLVNWEELQRLRIQARRTPAVIRVGEPRLYVATTADGLSLDLPLEHTLAFIAMLPGKLASETVEIFVQNGEGSQEISCPAADLAAWLERHEDVLRDGAMMCQSPRPHLSAIVGGVGGDAGRGQRVIRHRPFAICYQPSAIGHAALPAAGRCGAADLCGGGDCRPGKRRARKQDVR